MEAEIFEQIAECIRTNKPVALVTVISNEGSSPGKAGAVMAVWGESLTRGTVGGGNLELLATREALKCLDTGESREISYSLDETGPLGMSCGGQVRLYIKVFSARPTLVIVGAGHIGLELYKIALLQGFGVVVVDDRVEFAKKERFPQAEQVLPGDITEALTSFPITRNCFIAVATRSHNCDRQALEAVANSDAAYIGMIGSTNKVNNTLAYLRDQGVAREKLEAIYAPMGLNIASVQPAEIALGIMSEILLVKNGGTAEHIRDTKKIAF